MAEKWVYTFDEGGARMRDLLGGKGGDLAEMTHLGVPVPPGITVTTRACVEYLDRGGIFPEGLWDQVRDGMDWLHRQVGREFGNEQNPLLVSVRSGGKYSMPGMMDTVLNLGLNDESVAALARRGDERFAWDAYRRLIQMFGHVVLDVESHFFDQALRDVMTAEGVASEPEMSPDGWRQVVKDFNRLIEKASGGTLPQDPWVQLERSIKAVFESWNKKRAVDYRMATGIPHDLGTAVNIVTMVFGNTGSNSGSGVVFSRNPATGENMLYGEYLINAQGEDVVSGSRTPIALQELKRQMPGIYEGIDSVSRTLESHYREMQDMEFTVEDGKLWMLQTRNGKRTAGAAVKIAVDMVSEGLISTDEAVSRINPSLLDLLMHPGFDPEERMRCTVLASGLNASPGAAVGEVYFTANDAERVARDTGKPVILVRPETTPDDVHGMIAAQGILTQHGGATSHAAVVARQLGKPCVSGCELIQIDLAGRQFRVNERIVREGDMISLDGTTGEVILGKLRTVSPEPGEMGELAVLLKWADQIRRLEVWANADTPEQAAQARSFGAQGIGLCRTEHMFLGERSEKFQRAILSRNDEAFRRILETELQPVQQQDFLEIFKVMDGLPVTIRLLDPPLHEFLPPRDDLLVKVTTMDAAGSTGPDFQDAKHLLDVVSDMAEVDPMLGLRGCRLGLMRPDLNRMQVKAIFEAACEAAADGIVVRPKIMIPLTSHVNELKVIREILEDTAEQVMADRGVRIDYQFGTMIEVPRAALTAGEIAEIAEFFSFGTNDLTQMTFGISRDDAERKFLLDYVNRRILPSNPFQTLDVTGVGQLVVLALEQGREARADLEVGICGEHGGDPASINFFHRAGLDYVSCSPYRVPVARLAAAHSAIGDREKKRPGPDDPERG